MPVKKEQPIDVIIALEQFSMNVTNSVPIIADYYKALIANGVPHDLAEDLTRDWASGYWDSIFRSVHK